ncbi:chitin deacetylase [Mortierella polycephala]|uniref:Chitin deacetylase n=1 Tax=Mortierella polycephala TaxID=41804 RepID=A0A9P6U336_9FUNG|nr:chitin deacetylase [Mortierella polycephala]
MPLLLHAILGAAAGSSMTSEEAMELLAKGPESVHGLWNFHSVVHTVNPDHIRQEVSSVSAAAVASDNSRIEEDLYPPKDRIPDVSHPQVKAWIAEIDWSKVPNIPVAPGLADTPHFPACPPDELVETSSCWWSCDGCVQTSDIITCPGQNQWGLTYDDGPSEATREMMEYLNAEKITATFFIVGSRVLELPEILTEQVAQGHHIAMHTWSHAGLTTLTNEQIVAEIKWTEKIIYDTTGLTMKYIRPPYGDCDNRVREILRQMGYSTVIWTHGWDTNDWRLPLHQIKAPEIVSSFIKALDNMGQIKSSEGEPGGPITLEHDLTSETIDLSKKIIPVAMARGLMPMSLAKCLNDPNPYQEAEGQEKDTGDADLAPQHDANGNSSPNVAENPTKTTSDATTTTPLNSLQIMGYASSRHPFAPAPTWISKWIQVQRLDPALNETEGRDLMIDVVYTWVNGSDPKLQDIKAKFQKESPFFNGARRGIGGGSILRKVDQTANRYRDMDELKYSVRSVAQNAKGMFNQIHILTTEVDAVSDEGQEPSWLNKDTSKGVVAMVQHDLIFEDTSLLPSFNSLSIESQLNHVPNLTDTFLYLNDDVFLGTRMLVADVWTPLYGFVFHMEPSLLVPPSTLALPEGTFEIGEWHSLQYSNYLLSRQFGTRHRSYVAHVPHVLSVPMIQEMQVIWPEDFAKTSSHRFRGEGLGQDVHVSFFMAHYVMERLRETMLTSFWLHRLDADQDGILNWTERKQLIDRISQWNDAQTSLPVNDNFSSYLQNHADNLRQLGYPPSGSTAYKMSGLDGYPFMLKNPDTSSSADLSDQKPFYLSDEVSNRACRLDIDFCLGATFTNISIPEIDMNTSSAIFQRLAFSEFHCGDCLLHILRMSKTAEPGLGSEILPLDKDSNAFKAVSADLAKYNYVVATSPYSFLLLRDPGGSQKALNDLLARKDTDAFFCINDNIKEDPSVEQGVRRVFKQFLDDRFPTPSPWETPKSS